MDSQEQQIVEGIKSTSNILVTVSTDPSVDELSAALGLTLLLDKMDRRATAVFSGAIPPAIHFLEPDKTFENTADSLRDFIIALDKEKADHLRYKVDGDVVKIFITPYKTTLTQSDLEFSQGDYNVEMVIALGVKDQDHLDKALEAHGKILHDAKVVTITAGPDKSKLGSADWHNDQASSLSEMIVGLADALKTDTSLIDQQIATALLTGIVSATDRFSNNRTTSSVMTLAAELMAAGANQQLIAAKLEEAHDIAPETTTINDGGANDTASGAQGAATDTTELTISRSSKQKSEETSEGTSQEAPVDQTLADNQAELEQHLADLAPQNETMADIEKELKEAAEPEVAPVVEPQTPAPAVPDPMTAVADDATMPGFEPTGTPTPVTPEPVLPPLPQPEASQTSPSIINEHGSSMAITPPTDSAPAMNATLDDQQGESEQNVDVFNEPGTDMQQQGVTVAPPAGEGTPEGAAILSGLDAAPVAADPATTTASSVAPADLGATPASDSNIPVLPPLPPLPPLPTDANLPPLPPPPLPPTFAAGPAQAGAVSGDIFGDAAPATPPAAAPAAPEPGQFRIPGQ